jgi:hypothetical protein
LTRTGQKERYQQPIDFLKSTHSLKVFGLHPIILWRKFKEWIGMESEYVKK